MKIPDDPEVAAYMARLGTLTDEQIREEGLRHKREFQKGLVEAAALARLMATRLRAAIAHVTPAVEMLERARSPQATALRASLDACALTRRRSPIDDFLLTLPTEEWTEEKFQTWVRQMSLTDSNTDLLFEAADETAGRTKKVSETRRLAIEALRALGTPEGRAEAERLSK